MQKGFSPAFLIIGILVLAIVGVGAFYLGRQTNPKSSPAPVITSQSPQPTPSSTPGETVYTEATQSANWKTYVNKTYGYSFKYPSDWNLNILKADSTDGSSVNLTKDGYEFQFAYNYKILTGGIGGVSYIAAQTEEININNQKFLKLYANTDHDYLHRHDYQCTPYLGIDPQTGRDIKPKQECYDYVDQILINPPETPSGTADITGSLNINGRNAGFTFILPKLTKLNDKEFLQYNAIFNQILSTFKFTN